MDTFVIDDHKRSVASGVHTVHSVCAGNFANIERIVAKCSSLFLRCILVCLPETPDLHWIRVDSVDLANLKETTAGAALFKAMNTNRSGHIAVHHHSYECNHK